MSDLPLAGSPTKTTHIRVSSTWTPTPLVVRDCALVRATGRIKSPCGVRLVVALNTGVPFGCGGVVSGRGAGMMADACSASRPEHSPAGFRRGAGRGKRERRAVKCGRAGEGSFQCQRDQGRPSAATVAGAESVAGRSRSLRVPVTAQTCSGGLVRGLGFVANSSTHGGAAAGRETMCASRAEGGGGAPGNGGSSRGEQAGQLVLHRQLHTAGPAGRRGGLEAPGGAHGTPRIPNTWAMAARHEYPLAVSAGGQRRAVAWRACGLPHPSFRLVPAMAGDIESLGVRTDGRSPGMRFAEDRKPIRPGRLRRSGDTSRVRTCMRAVRRGTGRRQRCTYPGKRIVRRARARAVPPAGRPIVAACRDAGHVPAPCGEQVCLAQSLRTRRPIYRARPVQCRMSLSRRAGTGGGGRRGREAGRHTDGEQVKSGG